MDENKKNRYMDLGDVPEEDKKPVKLKRKAGRRAAMTAFVIAIIALIAITGCGYLYMSLQKAEADNAKMQAAIEQFPTNYTESQAAELVDQAVKKNQEEYLAKMKELILKDNSPVSMLRYFYPDELVAAFDSKYYFLPISETLKKNTYEDANFVVNENGNLEYDKDGVKISHTGIDVSKYQGDIDWTKVKAAGIEYAFIRLGIRGYESGKLVLDDNYEANIKGATGAGIGAGVYFFSQAITTDEAIEEANYVIDNIKSYNITYPVVFDIENINDATSRTNALTKEEWTAITIAFCERIKEAGYTPMIYGNLRSFLMMLDMEQLEGYEKWFAFYGLPVYYPYEYSILQYTEEGVVDGITEPVDMNITFE